MKTLFISDLDGTLLQPNVELSDTTVRIINEMAAKGVNFTIATARTIATVLPILRNVHMNRPIIIMNGVCIYDLEKKRYINVEAIDKENSARLLSIIVQNKLKGFAYTLSDGVMSTYYEELNSRTLIKFYEERVRLYKKPFIQIDDFRLLTREPLIFFSLMDKKENLDKVYPIIKALPDLNCTMYKDNYTPDNWYFEIFSKAASKYHGVRYLKEYLKAKEVVCFGDNLNDLPLFEASDYRIAVANAVDELKSKADEVIGSNTEDGVALWLKSNALKWT
jgi:Cof subfamily protein (haloacid dehalogenase superfamily)